MMARLGIEQRKATRDLVATGEGDEYTLPLSNQEDISRDKAASKGERRAPKRLQKSSPVGMLANRPSEPTPLAGSRPDPLTVASDRTMQSSIKEQRPARNHNSLHASPSRRYVKPVEIISPWTSSKHDGDRIRLAHDGLSNDQTANPPLSFALSSHQAPRQRQDSINNTSRFSFASTATTSKSDDTHSSNHFDFLPSVNFDEFHASIASDGPNISSFPSTRRNEDHSPSVAIGVPQKTDRPTAKSSRTADPSEFGSRLSIDGSLPRRHISVSHSHGQNMAETDTTSALNGPGSTKARRKSYFPAATTGATAIKAPRKSVGPGILTSETDLPKHQYHRPSFAQAGLPGGHATSEFTMGNGKALTGTQSGNLDSSRYQKAKSFQPPPRRNFDHASTPNGVTGDGDFNFGSTSRSPGRSNFQRTITPSSSKRLSIMPNSAHATGLAARTVSPTDARRMKRISMMPNPPPMPFTPPTPQPETLSSAGPPSAPSPCLLPRKSVTPSSSRTTPDHNRKSYSSGLSSSSNTSYNSCIATTSSIRIPQSTSTSRLPTPKSRGDNAALGDEEIVPPVPAIPKAYESPKGELDLPFFSSRKFSLPYDVNSLDSSIAPGGVPTQKEDITKTMQESRQNTVDTHHLEPIKERKPSGSLSNKRTLQPLRLPPLNLLPLSTPTATKIAALYDGSPEKIAGAVTPPPKKGMKATPTTPMTASRATFSKVPYDEPDAFIAPHVRSSSSHHTIRPEALSRRAPSSSSATAPDALEQRETNIGRMAISPFVSSSLPKASGDFAHLRREVSNPEGVPGETKPSRLTGPRLHKPRKVSKDDASSLDTASPIETSTPSLGTSIRRKLSLTRKRSISKAQTAADRDSEMPPKTSKHDDMPPPRLPASATWNGPLLSSPSPSQKVRASRNISNSSNGAKHERNRSNTWETADAQKKDAKISHTPTIVGPKRTARSILEGTTNQTSLSLKDFIREAKSVEVQMDRDDLSAEEEMKRLASKRKETEIAAKELDALRRRATAKDRASPKMALRTTNLNIYERGEIIDFEFEEKGIYFRGTWDAKKHVGDMKTEAANFGYDDDRGDYKIVNGDHLAYRYEIVDILGKGSFGQVVRCVDHKTGNLVAIKIIRNKKRFHQQALVEVDILKKLRQWDPQSKHSMVSFTQSFYFRGHLCISTELLGMNLYEFIKCHDFRGFSLKLIRRFAKQLLGSLVLLKCHKIIHCDLKPENVLLAHPTRSEIKVIDFGSSCLENEKVYTYIQSRFYRSPEVILGMTYGMPIDMWSLGCILAELLTGYPIFPGENEQEQLACIMEVFGPPEKHLIEKSTRKKLFFDSLGKPRITVSSKGKRRRPSSKSLQQALKCEDEAFLDFITRCLRWDPDRRLKPDEAIHHEFIAGKAVKQVARPRTAPANATSSPIKRYNSISQTPSSTRPLPDPPANSLKAGIAARNRNTSGSSSILTASPSKQAAKLAGPKRHSTVNGLQSNPIGTGIKRNVNGGIVQGSALPRVASTQRSTSGTLPGGLGRATGGMDLAAAAAAASLTTKSR